MPSFGRQLITFTYYYSIMMPSTIEINRYKVNEITTPEPGLDSRRRRNLVTNEERRRASGETEPRFQRTIDAEV